jgi:hypothetical protein
MLRNLVPAVALLAACTGSGCDGDPGNEGTLRAALETTFSNTSPYCPATDDWGAWGQTSLSTWDSDVQPVVQWIINRTGISCSTYSGHDPSIGRAADWRPHSREEGTQLANWFIANTKSGGTPLGIRYIIWQAQIYLIDSGVTVMADRGSFTQNHCDHIHISFVDSGSVHFAPNDTTPWGSPAPEDAGAPEDASAQDGGAGPKPDAGHDAGVPLDSSSPPTPPQPSAEAGPTQAHAAELTGGCTSARADGPAGAKHLALLLLAVLLTVVRRRG